MEELLLTKVGDYTVAGDNRTLTAAILYLSWKLSGCGQKLHLHGSFFTFSRENKTGIQKSGTLKGLKLSFSSSLRLFRPL